MRKEYEMTQEEYELILEISSQPRPYMLVGGVNLADIPQRSADAFWLGLSLKMGFVYDTVRPIRGKGPRFFSAVPVEGDNNDD